MLLVADVFGCCREFHMLLRAGYIVIIVSFVVDVNIDANH